MNKHKVLFITGTRADYGKIKTLLKAVEENNKLEAFVYVSGMHLIQKYGDTYEEILKDGYQNVYVDFSQANIGDMSYDLGDVICRLSCYVQHIAPDMIIVHGDRIDALAGAIVGALRNIKVVHIEGGELSGTIDESIRHAISKFAHIHLVSSDEAKKRLVQLGEDENRIFVIGSPDIDIMLSGNLPSMEDVRRKYEIYYKDYGIVMYHPVTTEFNSIRKKAKEFVDALIASKLNYIVIYPNNDMGSEYIMREYEKMYENHHFRVFPSLRFEYFLTLLKNSMFIIGNSSAGIRETGVYGIPAIDVGTRQEGRYLSSISSNIQHVNENINEILAAISNCKKYQIKNEYYGHGDSTEKFIKLMNDNTLWNMQIQKKFIDIDRSTL